MSIDGSADYSKDLGKGYRLQASCFGWTGSGSPHSFSPFFEVSRVSISIEYQPAWNHKNIVRG